MRFASKIDGTLLCILGYVFIIHMLFIKYYETTFELSYNGDLYVFSFNTSKYLFCAIETVFFIKIIYKTLKDTSLTAIIFEILTFLYFIPGSVQQAATDEPWAYMVFYFFFWIMLYFWMKKIPPFKIHLIKILLNRKDAKKYFLRVTVFALILAFILLGYHGKSFSFSLFQETLLDIYEVRAEETMAGTHWLITTIELWAAYFIVIATAYYSYLRKWTLVPILVVAEIALFLIAANRIFLFFEIAAICLGLFRVKENRLVLLMLIVAVLLFAEVLIIDYGLVFTDVFRRYSIVPNRIGGFYYDYFSTHTPDYLRSMYDRIASFMGLRSPYYNPPISKIIGQTYFGTNMGCNTGLVGGSMFCFGYGALLFSTFGYITTFRLFESTISFARNTPIKIILAFILASLAINQYAFLANLFSLSYMLLLFLSLTPLSMSKSK